jgi:hypothetical protein
MKTVAIKVMRMPGSDPNHSNDSQKRFEEEANLVYSLAHPNVVMASREK